MRELQLPKHFEPGRWRTNPAVAKALGIDAGYADRHLAHYTRRLAEGGKYNLTVWPYHAMLGSIGHALVSAVEETVFFHVIARRSQPDFRIKGDNPLTEDACSWDISAVLSAPGRAKRSDGKQQNPGSM